MKSKIHYELQQKQQTFDEAKCLHYLMNHQMAQWMFWTGPNVLKGF